MFSFTDVFVLLQNDAPNGAEEAANEAASWLWELGGRLVDPVVSIAVIIALSLLALRLLRLLVSRAVERVMGRQDHPPRELKLKADTLSNVIESGGRMLILLIATLMVLSNVGLDIGPLLASAGVVGLAIGFGAQSLIRDFISGFFILLEDQYGVGDYIEVNSLSGMVEHFSLRRTVLRGIDGTVITVPNGNIQEVQNMTKDWARAVLDIDVSYEDDINRAIEVITGELDGIENDEEIGDVIIAPPEVLGVLALGAYQVTIRAWVKTKPMEQWGVQREMFRRLKIALEKNGITIPYPHQVTVFRSEESERELEQFARSQTSAAAVNSPSMTPDPEQAEQ